MLKLCLILTLALSQTNAFGGTVGNWENGGFNKCNFDYDCKPGEHCFEDPTDFSYHAKRG